MAITFPLKTMLSLFVDSEIPEKSDVGVLEAPADAIPPRDRVASTVVAEAVSFIFDDLLIFTRITLIPPRIFEPELLALI